MPATYILQFCLLLLVNPAAQGAEQVPTVMTDRPASLPACPASPNCVSSDAVDSSHHVDAYSLLEPTEGSWKAVITAVRELPRSRVTVADESYLHAEVSSRVFGFVDDLELIFRPELAMIAVRSASRKGYWDLGANRSRVETLRSELRSRGLIR